MGFEPGGYADKLGNRYEGKWVARALLLLILEQLRSVTLEAVGDDEVGVDLWIEHRDGRRIAQQCKARNGPKAEWSFADLARRGVLAHAMRQIDRSPIHEFEFVSAVPATWLRDLSRSARDSNGDPEDFIRYQVSTLGRSGKQAFQELCRGLSVDSELPAGRAVAFEFLRRSDFHIFSDGRNGIDDLCAMAQLSVAGDPRTVIACLCDFAVENLRKTLTANDVHGFLRDRGLQVRRLLADERTAIQVDELRQDFVDSIEPHWAGGQMLRRPEANALFSLLEADPSPEAIIVHGRNGVGKSGVLYQLAETLKDRRIPFIAVRLDRRTPRGTPRAFGADIGLPESPVNCLEQLSAGGRAVLILDQLDALRWTRAHAAGGLDVCKALLREISVQRSLGRNLSMVIACRTFDLDHDPEIKKWLRPTAAGSRRFERVEVSTLPDDTVREVVHRCGKDPTRLSLRRLSLLAFVQNLAMWAELAQTSEQHPDFDNATQLMREFWRHKRREIEKAGHPADSVNSILNGLIDYMEHKATLSAPQHLLDFSQSLASDLQSLGVVQVSCECVTFCHQSYLDFLIADRAATRINDGASSVVDWLGDRSMQSLFRREQLRQLLFLLADENIKQFLRAVGDLLDNPEIRYHVKLLAVEALGQVTPSPETTRLVIELIDMPKWQEHVLQLVVQGTPDYLRYLVAAGVIDTWLSGEDAGLASNAIWLLSSVIDRSGDLVGEVCRPYLAQGSQAAAKVAHVLLRSRPDTEPDSVFAFRLDCIAAGAPPLFVSWKDLAERKPRRALQLLAALSTAKGIDDTRREFRGPAYGVHSPGERQAIVRAATKFPRFAWKVLRPQLLELARRRSEKTSGEPGSSTTPSIKIPRLLTRTMKAAGRYLARQAPDFVLKSIESMQRIRWGPVQRLIVETLAFLPPSRADAAICWLLADLRRLRYRSSRHRPRWLSARRLIAAMSPYCSDELFTKIEQTLLHYRDPEERRLGEFWLNETRYGIFRNRFGEAQYFLLPALCAKRCSSETTGRIGVLQRKFGDCGEDYFALPKMHGGFVRSPLDQSRLGLLSDRAWLRIINNAGLKHRLDSMRYHRRHPGGFIESSVEMFSRDFGVAALRDPERFARLALKLPATAPHAYLAGVLDAVARRNPPSEVPEDQRSQWAPAPPESFQSFLESIPINAGSWLAQQYCHALVNRDDIDFTKPIAERLQHFSNHQDPEVDSLHVYCDQRASECSLEALEQNAINCVRAMAARALCALLFRRPDYLNRFGATVECLLDDPHPVVRLAAVQVCLPLWNSNRQLAVEWLIRGVKDDDRIAACHHAREFYNCAFPEFAEELSPLIRQMIHSPIAEVAQIGSSQVGGRWIFSGLFNDELEHCCDGSVAQRKGVAMAAGRLVAHEKHFDRARVLVERLLDDDNSEVRAEAKAFLRFDEFLQSQEALPVLLRFVHTKAFQDDPVQLMFALDRNVNAIVPFAEIVLEACSSLCRPTSNAPEGIDRRFHAGELLSSLLLRLYEQCDGVADKALRQRCLDAWDSLLENGIGQARSLLQQLDAYN